MLITPPRRFGRKPPKYVAKVVVLLSGGIDSATTLSTFVRQRGDSVDGLFVDYGQAARRSEWEAAQAIADHYSCALRRVRLGVRLPQADGEYFSRNALLVLIAAALSRERPLVIATGLHVSSPYYDTTPAFVEDVQRLLDGYAGGTVTFSAPFLSMTKGTIVKYARRHRVPLSLTYSCERRNETPCGKCFSCQDRKECRVD